MFRHDKNHTGRTPYSGPSSPTVRWTYQAGEGIACSPSLGADGTIYFGCGSYQNQADSSLYALNPDGSLKWTFFAGSGIFSSPAVDEDGAVYFSSMEGMVYALEDSVTYARQRWQYQMSFKAYSSPVVADDGTVYAGGLDFRLYAIDPGGNLKWDYITDWCVFSSPILGPAGEIYVGSKDHHLYCFEDSVTYGKLRWKHPFGTFYDGHLVDSSPARGPDGTLYVGVDPYGAWGQEPVPIDTSFYAVNPDGSRKWSFQMPPDGTEASPAIGEDGMIYLGANNGQFYAIRDAGNEPVVEWTFSANGPIDGSAAIDGNGVIYFGSRDSTLYALNPDGTLRWSYMTGGGIESSPTIDQHGNLYIGSFDGKMYAFGTGGDDVGVKSIEMQREINPGVILIPEVVVQNYREGARNIRVTCTIDTMGVQLYTDTVTVSNLTELDPCEAGFDPWTAGPDTGVVYTVNASVILNGDDNSYNDNLTADIKTVLGTTTDTGDESGTPALYLGQCYPNPFNPSTTIRFGLDEPSVLTLRVYDVSGKLVRTLISGRRDSGEHDEVWNGTDDSGRNVSSGVYFYRLKAGSFTQTRKMVLLR
jgi:outer membrane protein assembly factor BamB